MKPLQKYLREKRSIFDNFSEEIIFLARNNASQKSILKFLKDNGILATQSNLSKWIKRHKKQKKLLNMLEEQSVIQEKSSEIKINKKIDIFKNLKGKNYEK